MALYRRACDGGIATGCHNLAGRFAGGIGVAVDGAQAAALYEEACDAGEARSCLELGRLYETGDGMEADPARAFAFFRRACALGDIDGCCRPCRRVRDRRRGARGTTEAYMAGLSRGGPPSHTATRSPGS